ncbi:MAG: hypothetical protein E7035_07420 [Verrucomicrobiaceae bacterium]|nr:hypothetical protein [Verrucomicrobiaceae bacterium]
MRVIIFIFLFLFSSSTFAENYLMNAKVVSSNECTYPNIDFKYLCATREFYEFIKIFTLQSPQKAQNQYRNLVDNGRTPEARLWGYLGLRLLGVISDEQAVQSLKARGEKVRYLNGSWLEENLISNEVYSRLTSDYNGRPARYPRSIYPKLPEKYFDVDLSRYYNDISPESLRNHAKRLLKEADMIVSDYVSAGAIYTKEAWAFNYFRLIADPKTRIDDIKEIFETAQFDEGKLYAYVLLKRLGYSRLAEELNAQAKLSEKKYCSQSGCIVGHEDSYERAIQIAERLEHYIAPKRTDSFYNRTCHQCLDKHISEFNFNAKENRYDKPFVSAQFKTQKVSEVELPLPRRFDINFNNKLSLGEAYLLAQEFYNTLIRNENEASEIKACYEKYLKFYEGKPTTIFSQYGSYVAISKHENSFKFDVVKNGKIEDYQGKCISFVLEDILRSFGDNHFYSAMNFCKKQQSIFSKQIFNIFANSVYAEKSKPCKVDKWVAIFDEHYVVSLTPFFEENKNSAKYKESVKLAFKIFNKANDDAKMKFTEFCSKNKITPVWEIFPDIIESSLQ